MPIMAMPLCKKIGYPQQSKTRLLTYPLPGY